MSLETARRVLQIEAQAIQDMLARLNANFERAVDVLFACKGRVAVSGMGKSGLIGRKISATLSSTGTTSFFLHPAEALHGDLGMLARGDAMLAVSYGGETQEIIQLLEALKDAPAHDPQRPPGGYVDGLCAVHARKSQRRRRGRQREGRSVFAQSRADGKHNGCDGSGRCARGCASRKAQFPAR